jgi:hypothetical protein
MCQNSIQLPSSSTSSTQKTAPARSSTRRGLAGCLAAAAAALALSLTGAASAQQEGVIKQTNAQKTKIYVNGGTAQFTIVGKPGDQCFGQLPGGGLFFAGTLSNLRYSSWATSWSPAPNGKFSVKFRFLGVPGSVHGGFVIVKRNGAIIDKDVVIVN